MTYKEKFIRDNVLLLSGVSIMMWFLAQLGIMPPNWYITYLFLFVPSYTSGALLGYLKNKDKHG